MNTSMKVLIAGLMFVATLSVPAVQAQTPSRELARTQAPAKGEPCRPKWPYVVLTCVA